MTGQARYADICCDLEIARIYSRANARMTCNICLYCLISSAKRPFLRRTTLKLVLHLPRHPWNPGKPHSIEVSRRISMQSANTATILILIVSVNFSPSWSTKDSQFVCAGHSHHRF